MNVNFLKNIKSLKIKSFGSSMSPIILDKDVIYIKKIKFKNIKINDIITFYKQNKLITHRVIFKKINYLYTKGDNNQKFDGKIKNKNILGLVHKLKRNGKEIDLDTFYLFQSTLYYREILKFKRLLDKKNINYLILKGLPVHLLFYNSYPKIIYADCDFLIDPNDFKKAEIILQSLRYQRAVFEYSKIHSLLKDKQTEVTYFKKINNLRIFFDIHLEPVFLMNQLGRMDTLYPQNLIENLNRLFLDEKQKVTIEQENYPILSTENLIIYLALHFFHHNYQGISRIELLDKVIRLYKLDNSKLSGPIIKKINDYKLQNFVYPVFLILEKYLQTPVPNQFKETIKPEPGKLRYIQKKILRINIFNQQSNFRDGKQRFMNIFILSASPLYKKIFIFLSPAVIFSILWVIWTQVSHTRLVYEIKKFYTESE